MEKLVIVPTYNELENIEELLTRVLGLPYDLHILIVDDNSPDGTANVVKEWQKKTDRVHLLQRPGKMGLGSAYLQGFAWALERGLSKQRVPPMRVSLELQAPMLDDNLLERDIRRPGDRVLNGGSDILGP